MSFASAGDSLTPKTAISAENYSVTTFERCGTRAPYRLVIGDLARSAAEAVELRPHRAAIGAKHPDLDIIAGPDVGGELERSRHMVEVVAGRPVEAELHRA